MSTESHTPGGSSTPMAFSYRAVTREGQTLSGTIDAKDVAEANQRLASLQLSDVKVETTGRPPRAASLRGDDFAAFNQQLAQLTGAGLPVEHGLRLIASEMGRGSLKRTLDLVAADLESGKTLPQAIAAHRAQFPPLYASLIDAGIRAGNLPRILLNLGRHLTLVRRLQSMLWRTFPYPILVAVGFTAMICFILVQVLPQIEGMYKEFHTQMPLITVATMKVSHVLANGGLWSVFGGLAVIILLAFFLLWLTGRERLIGERLLLMLPLIGPVLRRNLISRWCDAVGIGVEAGMDLPAAIGMADDAIGSSSLRSDGQQIVDAISMGRPIAQGAGRVLPRMVFAAMDFAAARNDLPQGMFSLSELYQQQAELRLGAAEVILMPLLIIFMGIVVGLVLTALFAPMLNLFSVIS